MFNFSIASKYFVRSSSNQEIEVVRNSYRCKYRLSNNFDENLHKHNLELNNIYIGNTGRSIKSNIK